MALAVWIVCGGFALIWFGTWALQIALFLLQLGLRAIGAVAVLAFGLVSVAALALFDRAELRRIWRRQRPTRPWPRLSPASAGPEARRRPRLGGAGYCAANPPPVRKLSALKPLFFYLIASRSAP